MRVPRLPREADPIAPRPLESRALASAGVDDAHELLAEMRRLAERFPVPHPLWHRYVPQMREVIADFRAAVVALESLPDAHDELLRQVEGTADDVAADAGGPALAAARERLRSLPVPEGEHPYIDEILVGLEAADAALAALAAAGGDIFPAGRSPAAPPQ